MGFPISISKQKDRPIRTVFLRYGTLLDAVFDRREGRENSDAILIMAGVASLIDASIGVVSLEIAWGFHYFLGLGIGRENFIWGKK